jgi:Sulfotransferase family
MIVSHEHRFIFLKTKKTAGTSVEVFLSQIAGPDAIVTPEDPKEPGHVPRNWRGGWNYNFLPAMRADPEAPGAFLRHPRGRLGLYRHYWNHMPAWLARAKLGEEIWNGYFKFCFERNPWDKVVSLYWWYMRDNGWFARRKGTPPTLDEFMDDPRGRRGSDWHLYAIDGEIAVDAVGRYESLTGDLGSILDRIGVRAEVELPRAKSSYRRRDDSERLSRQSAERIGEVFRREIEAFGYECPPELLAR